MKPKLKSTSKFKKSNLTFSASEMKWLRTPKPIWKELSKEFEFTIDCCASHQNALLPRYYTAEDDCLTKDWSGEVAYIHPLFDTKIPKFIEKAYNTDNFTGVFLLPASTHTKYFHDFCYHNKNCEIRFLRKPTKGFHFGPDDGTEHPKDKVGYIKPLMILIFRNYDNTN